MAPHYRPFPHVCEIIAQGFGESDQKHTPFFFLEFRPLAEVIGGETKGIEGKYSRTLKLYLTEKTVDRVRKFLTGLGWNGETFGTLEPAAPNFHNLAGVETVLECSHGENGFEEWQTPYDGPAAEPKQSDASIGRKLDALFGGKSTGAKKSTPPTRRAPPVDPSTPAAGSARNQGAAIAANRGDDDIPF